MCEVESNIRLSWLLVSQFVSWDFCRYMCEQSDNQKWELDVLTFLRNMVVERTEKAANDITKHEIVARFVMEVRSMQSAARMPFIQELSHKVVEKCPELKMAIFEMLYKLKELLDDLEESEDIHIQRKLMASIASEVNKFNLEACKSLPLPNLLQVIRTWINCESQAEIWRESQNIEDRDLYRKVVYCLQEEKITTEEAKIIAQALYDDKVLKRIINTSKAETEDSQSQSPSTNISQILQRYSCLDHPSLAFSQRKPPSLIPEPVPGNSTQAFAFNPVCSSPPSNCQKEFDLSSEDSFNPSSPEEPIGAVKTQRFEVMDRLQDLGPLNVNKSFLFKPVETEIPIPAQTSHIQDSEPMNCSDSDSSNIIPISKKSKSNAKWKEILTQLDIEDSLEEPRVTKSKRPPTPILEDLPLANSSDCSDSDLSNIIPVSKKSKSKSKWKEILTQLNIEDSLKEPQVTKSKRPPSPILEDIPLANSSHCSDSNSSNIIPVSKKSKSKSKWKEILTQLNIEDSLEPQITKSKRSPSPIFENVPLANSNSLSDIGNESDSSDCDKNAELRFLTPTIFKSDYVPHDKDIHVVPISDNESHGSSITTNPTNSELIDPTFKIRSSTSTKGSVLPPKKRQKTSVKTVPPTKQLKKLVKPSKPLLRSNKISETSKQPTLRQLGFSSNVTDKNQNTGVTKKRFKLFNNDAIFTRSSDESSLFEKDTRSVKQNLKLKELNLGNKRRCEECKITFRTPTELKKHVFIKHTVEDLSDD